MSKKLCPRCGERPRKTGPSGKEMGYCAECKKYYWNIWRKTHPDIIREKAKKWYSSHKEKVTAANREYNIRNRDDISQKRKDRYRKMHPQEKVLRRPPTDRKAWYASHREEVLFKQKAYKEKKRSSINLHRMEYYLLNKEKIHFLFLILFWKKIALAESRSASARAKVSVWQKENPEKKQRNNAKWKKGNKDKISDYSRKRRAAILGAKDFDKTLSLAHLCVRDNWICHICFKPIAKGNKDPRWGPSLDHIIPLSKGGDHTWKNAQLAHRSCNSSKNARVMTQKMLPMVDCGI